MPHRHHKSFQSDPMFESYHHQRIVLIVCTRNIIGQFFQDYILIVFETRTLGGRKVRNTILVTITSPPNIIFSEFNWIRSCPESTGPSSPRSDRITLTFRIDISTSSQIVVMRMLILSSCQVPHKVVTIRS